jgi:1,2-diacylglycerol 3-beta-galactosyltransferase
MARILFALSDTGFGHRNVALAIAEAMHGLSDDVVTSVHDVYRALGLPPMSWAPEIYGLVSRRSVAAYNLAWDLTNDRHRCDMAVRGLYRLAGRRLRRLCHNVAPDLVVVTHPLLITDLIAQARRDLQAEFRIVTVVPDPVNPHASWASADVDKCFVVSGPAGRRIADLGVSVDRISTVSFPIAPAFLRPTDKRSARAAFGLPATGPPLVLIAGGGAGSGAMRMAISVARTAVPGATIMVAPGRNSAVRRAAESSGDLLLPTGPGSLYHAMCAADLLISKAGPSTIFEAAAIGVPLLLTCEVGRQEQGNIRLAEELGVARSAPDRQKLASEIKAVLHHTRWSPRPHLAMGASEVANALLTIPRGAPAGHS